MAKNLLIVESPAKSKTLKKFLGKNFDVMATVGHVIDLPKSRIGVDMDNDFKPEYVVIDGKDKIIKELRAAARKVEHVYLAPDPDREGEAIAWHVANSLKKGKSIPPISRIAFNAITKKAVSEAFDHAREIDMDLVNAQQARRVLDRIVGYKVSPFLWQTIARGLSAGRVQSVALRIICEREEAVRAFTPQEYWEIEVELANIVVAFSAVKGGQRRPISIRIELPYGASHVMVASAVGEIQVNVILKWVIRLNRPIDMHSPLILTSTDDAGFVVVDRKRNRIGSIRISVDKAIVTLVHDQTPIHCKE